jgi:formyltetrahydrofolate synthetase
MEEERKNKKEITDRLDILNEKFNKKLESEITKRSQDITSLTEETQQRIQVVNSKFNSLGSGVYENLELQMSENKQNHKEMSKKLYDSKKEVESKFDNIQSEIVNLRH